MAATQLESSVRVHPMDMVIRALSEYSAPSATDGLSVQERIALPATQDSLKAAEVTARGRFSSRLAGTNM